MTSDNAYSSGQALAELLKGTSVQAEIDTCSAVNLAAIAYELHTANLARVAESLSDGARRAEEDGLDDAKAYEAANRIGQMVLDRLGLEAS